MIGAFTARGRLSNTRIVTVVRRQSVTYVLEGDNPEAERKALLKARRSGAFDGADVDVDEPEIESTKVAVDGLPLDEEEGEFDEPR